MTQLPRTHPVMAALANGCPLTLLVDLADPDGPDSRRIMAREHADMAWLEGLRHEAVLVNDAGATARQTG